MSSSIQSCASHTPDNLHAHTHPDIRQGLPSLFFRKLGWVMTLTVGYVALQVVGSWMTGSLSLQAQAGHKFGDIGGIALAFFAAWFAEQPAPPEKTYGHGRIEIFAALVNACILTAVGTLILLQAYGRTTDAGHHHNIEGNLMLGFSLAGLAINLIGIWILHPEKERNLNVKGAYFHILADVLGSVGTSVSALLILFLDWHWADTLISGCIGVLILFNATQILAQAFHILMEGTPKHLLPETVRQFILKHPGIEKIDELYLWSITTGRHNLLCHAKVQEPSFQASTVTSLEDALRHEFDLCHVTLQLEPETHSTQPHGN